MYFILHSEQLRSDHEHSLSEKAGEAYEFVSDIDNGDIEKTLAYLDEFHELHPHDDVMVIIYNPYDICRTVKNFMSFIDKILLYKWAIYIHKYEFDSMCVTSVKDPRDAAIKMVEFNKMVESDINVGRSLEAYYKKTEGIPKKKSGRKFGSTAPTLKLDKDYDLIQRMVNAKIPQIQMSRILKVSRDTLRRYIIRREITREL